ncbi:MAG: LamG domain-containing protein, partial [Ignavibacteriales bacterium]
MKFFLQFLAFIIFLSASIYAQSSGSAVEFDGIDGNAVAHLNTGNTNSTMTMEFWFARVSDQVNTVFLGDLHSISSSNRRRVMPYLNNGVIHVYAAPNTGNDGNAIDQSTGIVPALNVWTHVAVTISAANLKMYVNGNLYINTSLTDAYALTGTEVLSIATDYWNSSFANIRADEIRIWSSERTQAQIQANMYKELGGGEANLLAYYKLNNGAGTLFEDSQFLGICDGTLSGGITWQPSGAFAETKNALQFDGEDDYVNCGNGAMVQCNGTQSLTVEAWVKPTAAFWGAVVSKFQHHPTHEGYSLEMFSDYRVAFLFGNNWSNWLPLSTNIALTPNTWNHIAVSYDSDTIKIYINGRLDVSARWTDGCTDSGTDLVIGSRMGTTVYSTFFNGNIDEVRVWNVARTEAQLRENMCRTLRGDEANLQAYYRLDENNGITAYDNSNNSYNGTLTDMEIPSDWVASDAFNTWIGAESDSWTSSGNWAKGVPAADQNVGIYKWNLGNEAAISSTPTVRNLLISSTSSPTLNSGITVNGNLLLEKNLDLNGNNITLGSTSYLLEGSGVLSGTAGTISTTRILNNISSVNVALLGATVTTASSMGSTTVTRGHAVQTGNGHSSILRYYDITPTNNASLNATLAFNYRDSELNALTEANFKLYRSTDNGSTWFNQGGTLNAGANTLTKSGISSFSRWTVADNTLPINAPVPAVLAAIEGTALPYSEGDGEVQITSTLSVSDVDDVNLDSAIVQVTTNYQNSEDELTFVNQNGITGLWNGSLGTLTLTGTATLANYQTALRSIYFRNTSDNPSTLLRTISFTVNDGDSNSNTITRQISFTTINDAPVLASIEPSQLIIAENNLPVIITSTLTATDIDDVNLESAVIQISGNYQNDQDVLSFNDQLGITGAWDNVTGMLTLSGTSSVVNYQTALRNVSYSNTSNNPSTLVRTVSFSVNDGDLNSNAITRQIIITSVNDAPVLANIEATATNFSEGDAPVIISSNISVTDVDDVNIDNARVFFSQNYQPGEDVLAFTN